MTKEVKNYAKAYAFFNAGDAPYEDVNIEVKDLLFNLQREAPSNLEVTLNEMPDFKRINRNDTELIQALDTVPLYQSRTRDLTKQINPIKMGDLKYALTARCEGTNDDAGSALGFIMNGLIAKYGEGKYPNQIVGKGSEGHYDFWTNE